MKRGGLAVVVVLALMMAAPIAQADQPSSSEGLALTDLPDVAAPQIDDPISVAELEDLKTLASQQGMSLQDAIDRYAWNDNFALAVSDLREKYPDAFAGAEIVGARGAWVGFAADAPDAAIEIIDAFEKAHTAVEVQVRPGFGFTEVELANAVATVHYAALGANGVRDATTTFDYETRQITSAVALGDGAVAALDDVRDAATGHVVDSGLGKLLERIAIKVLESDVPRAVPADSTAHIGGEAWSDCTSGFTVMHWDGRTGIVTAGHCQTSQSDDGRALTHQAQHDGTFGDFQWHTGPQTEPDDFYSGTATTLEANRRDVAAWSSPVVGQAVCKNGKAGFKDCDTVMKKHVCTLIYCEFVQTEHHYVVLGDSGGPWFYGNTAYGVTYGYHWDPVWPFTRDLFSDVSLLDYVFEVQVRK